MHSVSLLIKPASGLCNLNCKYCFYHDEMSKRENSHFGIMTSKTFKTLFEKFINLPDIKSISLAFQGGEPTIAGLSFFRNVISTVRELNTNNIDVFYSIQTNATLLDEEWAKFLYENRFLVGVSLDGDAINHNLYRIDNNGNETHSLVLSKIELLQKYNVDFNILTVVTKNTCKNIEAIYRYYKEKGFMFQQYIPCLDPLHEKKGNKEYSLLPHDYELFLNKLFNLYYNDIKSGKYIYNRFFENIITILLGGYPEICSMNGCCSIQYVCEANGNIYPCDFYSVDEYFLGNINTNTIEEIDNTRKKLRFIENSMVIPDRCRKCKYLRLCRTGCRRDKETNNIIGKNFYCSSLYNFFEKNISKLNELANLVKVDKYPKQ